MESYDLVERPEADAVELDLEMPMRGDDMLTSGLSGAGASRLASELASRLPARIKF